MLVKPAGLWRRWRVSLGPLVIVTTLAWLVWRALHAPAAQIVLVPAPVMPAPAVVVHVPPPPAPPPAPAPPPPPPTDLAPPTIGRTCPTDIAAIGLPLREDAPRPTKDVSSGAVSQTGCTIAAWSADTLYVSWDGGQTFATADRTGLDRIAVADGRVLAVRHDHAIGVMTADAPWTWRAPPAIPQSDASPPTLLAAGRYTVLFAPPAPVAKPPAWRDALIAFSTDDGQRWSYVAAPVRGDAELALEPTGDVLLTDTVSTYAPGADESMAAPTVHVARRATGLAHPAWRPFRGAGWRYELVADFTTDHFTTAHVTATHDGHTTTIWTGLRTDNTSPTLGGHFAIDSQLVRFSGTRIETLPGKQPELDGYSRQLLGEDVYGSAILLDAGNVLRWSDRGGWRVLL